MCEPENSYVNDIVQENSKLVISKGREWSFRKNSLIGLFYIQGNYYFIQDLTQGRGGEIIFPKGAQVLKIDNVDIDQYVVSIGEKLGSHLRWDAIRKKYYTKHDMRINSSADTIIVTVKMLDESIKEIVWPLRTRMYYHGYAFSDEEEAKVLYFADENMLYIRIPEMDVNQLPFYKQEIEKMNDRQINKVVLDVRDNMGGSDRTWREVLAAIIDQPIIYHTTLLFKNTPLIISYLNNIRGDSLSYDRNENITIGNDLLFCRYNGWDTIAPSSNSIAYTGDIYILANERCFSSTGSLLSVSHKVDRLISVGESTGNISGVGVNPFILSLPYSKLIFRMVTFIEGISGTNVAEYYHDKREIYVEQSPSETVFEANCGKEQRYDEAYLFNHDPVFKKVLEQ